MSLYTILKTVFIALILLNIAPKLIHNIHAQYNNYIKPKTQVGVITIKDQLTDSSAYNKHLHTLFENQEIKAILIKMDCPGGASGTSQAIHNELLSLKNEYHKPVVVLVENVCASGGFYIAAAADSIIAPGTALIGSIGAYIPYLFQLREFIEDHKINYASVKAGAYKGTGDPFITLTPESKAQLQSVVDDSYQQFVADIAKNRKLAVATSSSWADGKIFSARQAQQLGLIDHLGSASTAIKIIKEKALIEGDIEWVHLPQENMWAGLLSADDDHGSSLTARITNSVCSALESRYASEHKMNM